MPLKLLQAVAIICLVMTLSSCDDGKDSTMGLSVSIANLNILHGFACDPPLPGDGDQCRVRNRVALLREFLIQEECPDVVTLQEIVNLEFVQRSPTESAGPLDSLVDLINAELPVLAASCGFTYQMLYQPFLPAGVAETDEEMILSRYPILQTDTHIFHSALYDEAGGFLIFARHLLYARIDHPSGEVDVYTTHLSSSSDAATNNCNSFYELLPGLGVGPSVDCPIECDSDDTVRACQSEQLALYVEQTRGVDNLALITGDFNAVPDTSEYRSMTKRGWLDTHLSAGTAECDSASGIGCTSGRSSSAESLDNPERQVSRRIDYIFAVVPEQATHCRVFDAAQTPSGHYSLVAADIFAGDPNPFAESCGSPPADVCWTSDHSGNYAKLRCSL